MITETQCGWIRGTLRLIFWVFLFLLLFQLFTINIEYFRPGYPDSPPVIWFLLITNSAALYDAGFIGLSLALAVVVSIFWRTITMVIRYSSDLSRPLIVCVILVLAFLPSLCWLNDFAQQTIHEFIGICSAVLKPTQNSILPATGQLVTFTKLLCYLTAIVTLILTGWFVSLMMDPIPRLKDTSDGLVIQFDFWSLLIGEKLFPWSTIKSVALRTNSAGQRLELETTNGKYLLNFNQPDIWNAIVHRIPNAVQKQSFVSSTSRRQTFTSLWLDQLSSPTRKRFDRLKQNDSLYGERLLVRSEIGRGGEGVSYLALLQEDVGPKEIVLKEYVFPTHLGRDFERECVSAFRSFSAELVKLVHPNIVTTLQSFVEDHRGYLILEYVNGTTLEQLVEKEGPLPESVVCDIALQLCKALGYLHSLNPPLFHGDLAPDNILLQPNSTVKLIDFCMPSRNGKHVAGKIAYIAPEQLRGKPSYRSDIYSLGKTLSYLLTGEQPQPLETEQPIPSASQQMSDLITRATDLNEALRYQCLEEMMQSVMLISAQSVSICPAVSDLDYLTKKTDDDR